MNNKCSFELSVKVIVILIIALVLLGLIIFFVTTTFTKKADDFERYSIPSDSIKVFITSPSDGSTYYASDVISFDGSGSYDTLGNRLTKYEWDFNGDNTVDASAAKTDYAYTNAGTYKIKLKVTNEKLAYAEKTITITIKSGNIKDLAKYSQNQVFIVKDDTDHSYWGETAQLITLAMWKEEGKVKNYKLVAHYGDIDEIGVSSGYIVGFDKPPSKFKDLDLQTDYLSFWKNIESVVVISPDDKEIALPAALFASSINAPLLFIEFGNLDDYTTLLSRTKMIYWNGVENSVETAIKTKTNTEYTELEFRTKAGTEILSEIS